MPLDKAYCISHAQKLKSKNIEQTKIGGMQKAENKSRKAVKAENNWKNIQEQNTNFVNYLETQTEIIKHKND